MKSRAVSHVCIANEPPGYRFQFTARSRPTESEREWLRAGIEGSIAKGGDAASFEPTLFATVESGMTIAQEEIFGPAVSVIPYDDVDDRVRIANDSIHGLNGAVFTNDIEHA